MRDLIERLPFKLPPWEDQLHFSGVSESLDSLIFNAYDPIDTLVVARDLKEAERFFQEYDGHQEILLITPKDLLTYKIVAQSKEVLHKRAYQLATITRGFSGIVVTTLQALGQRVIKRERLQQKLKMVRLGDSLDLTATLRELVDFGYERVDKVTGWGEFSLRGDILDIFFPGLDDPVRLEFFGDEIDRISSFSVKTQRSLHALEEIFFYPALESVGEVGVDESIKERVGEDFFSEESIMVERDRFLQSLGLSQSLISFIEPKHLVMTDPAMQLKRYEQYYEEYQFRLSEGLERQETFSEETDNLLQPGILEQRLKGFKQLLFSTFSHPHSDLDLHSAKASSYHASLTEFLEELRRREEEGYLQLVLQGEDQRIETLFREEAIPYGKGEGSIQLVRGWLSKGFVSEPMKFALYTQGDLFTTKKKRRVSQFGKHSAPLSSAGELKPGDYVVHIHHGIGRYLGIETKRVEDISRDYLALEYAKQDKLFIPTENVHQIQRYIGGDVESVKLTRLGTGDWQRKKAKAQKSIEDMTDELIELYAARQSKEGYAFSPDTPWQQSFESDFEYEETGDQLRSIREVKADMESRVPMDRLLCGDVGFGKTEVALRAIFKASMDSKQSAILVPTTILARQHFERLQERFMGYPINIAMLTRMVSPAMEREIKKKMREGTVDVVVGTHKLLSKDIQFKDLGLLVIDEEQRFGVRHKETIRQMKDNVDTLAMSATPIPRTLNMSLNGIRDMSLIAEPPMDRYPVQTYITEYDETILREAIRREVERGGQVYYIYNRTKEMSERYEKLQESMPEIRMDYAHGQMNERLLEQKMMDFVEGETDVLISTTIVETGLDIANVNTIIIENAQNFGLSQLYQLRGRVGRSNRVAYAYLFYPRGRVLVDKAKDRLESIKEFTSFGSGFRIAMRDLEIRGGGNLLGSSQSGHFEDIGFELYMQMLENHLAKIRGNPVEEEQDLSLDLGLNAYIPSSYIKSQHLKMEMYQKVSRIRHRHDKDMVYDEFVDRFGDLPEAVVNLIDQEYLRSLLRELNVSSVELKPKQVLFYIEDFNVLTPAILQWMHREVELVIDLKRKPHLRYDLEYSAYNRDRDLEKLIRIVEKIHQQVQETTVPKEEERP